MNLNHRGYCVFLFSIPWAVINRVVFWYQFVCSPYDFTPQI